MSSCGVEYGGRVVVVVQMLQNRDRKFLSKNQNHRQYIILTRSHRPRHEILQKKNKAASSSCVADVQMAREKSLQPGDIFSGV